MFITSNASLRGHSSESLFRSFFGNFFVLYEWALKKIAICMKKYASSQLLYEKFEISA